MSTPNNLFNVLGGITLVALATALVSSRNTAAIVTAAGKAYGGILTAALGK
jgi:hypothetical protein